MRDLRYALVIGLAAVLTLAAWAEDALAQSCTFTKVADTNTPIPGGTGTFEGFGDPSLDGGKVAFAGKTANEIIHGIYTNVSGSLVRVADANTPIPDGTGTFRLLGDPSLDGGNVAFAGENVFEFFQGIYTDLGGTLAKVIDTTDSLDGKTIQTLEMGREGLSEGQIAFRAIFSDLSSGIYLTTPTCVPGDVSGDRQVDLLDSVILRRVLAGLLCGDGVVQPGEECEPTDDGACPGQCIPPDQAGECRCRVPCVHDECVAGVPLDPICDPCVEQICAADSFCCDTQWDRNCIDAILSICGLNACAP